jgi:hypothetical protein
VWHGKEDKIRVDRIRCRVLKRKIGKPLQVGMDLIERGPGKFAGHGADHVCGRVVREETDQLTTGIPGCPDNRNFHTRIFLLQNLNLLREKAANSADAPQYLPKTGYLTGCTLLRVIIRSFYSFLE